MSNPPKLSLEDAIRDAVTAREVFTLEVLEAEFEQWNAVGANKPAEVHIRVALRGSINRLKDAYKIKKKETR